MSRKTKILSTVCLAILGLIFIACIECIEWNCKPSLQLPDRKELISITIYADQNCKEYSDSDIDKIMQEFTTAKSTRIQSVQDVPLVEQYWTVSLNLKNQTTEKLYVYQKNGRWYLEKPYVVICRLEDNFHSSYFQ